MFSHDQTCGLWRGGPQKRSTWSLHPSEGTGHSADSDHLTGLFVCQASPHKLSPHPFHTVLLGRKSWCLRGGQLYPTSLRQTTYVNYLEFFCIEMCWFYSIYLISNLFVLYGLIWAHICTHILYEYFYYTLTYNPLLGYFVDQIVPTLPLFQLVPSFTLVPLRSPSLLSSPVGCSRLILYFSVLVPAVSPKNPSSFLSEDDIPNKDLGNRCIHSYWGLALLGPLRWQSKGIYVCIQLVYLHTSVNTSVGSQVCLQ